MNDFTQELEDMIALYVDRMPRGDMVRILRDAAEALDADDEDEDGA